MTDLDRAKAIARAVVPGCNPEATCMIVAAAAAGIRGLTMRHIRVGALFWPEKFADDPALSMRGGWGCEGYDERSGVLYLASHLVDEDDGGFSGHTWLEPTTGIVTDLMHDIDGVGAWALPGTARYIRRLPLERAVKRFWRRQMHDAIRRGRKST